MIQAAYEGKTRATTLAEALLRDRAERTARPRAASRPKAASRDKTPSGLPDTAPPEMSQLEGSENRIKRASLIGSKDFPINIIGGYRFPQAKPLGRVRVRPWS